MKFFPIFFLLLALSLAPFPPLASGQNVMHVDASAPIPPPQPVAAVPGSYPSPGGDTFSMNSRYLMLDGKPWLPVMGEFHYSRVPEEQWEDEILKMKSAGVQVISTYVIWIHQEEVEGQFDWSGQRDLRHFVQLCAQHHMYVYVRIGPWTHGETRNGGFPDWLLRKVSNPRTTDPVFLSYVKTYFDQIGDQLHGLLWKDGGPVIGIQLENEYSRRGPGAGDAYILALQRLAIQAGLQVPIDSVTGWDNAVIPNGAVVAMFGGYPDAPWLSSLQQSPPQEVYAFRFGSRATGNMGAMGKSQGGISQSRQYDYPFMTTEMGGGVEDTYHRRPVIQPNDVAAMMPVMLGSGVNLYGTYMFQGGENPQGKLSTLQESQATGYPNDLPVRSYDFQAPLGEFGEEREVFRKLKVFNYFLNDFGDRLAPMTPFAPSVLPKSPADRSVPRISVRTNGQSGFIFFNNYVRSYSMPARAGFQVRIQLPGGEISVPARPITLPSGARGIWPFDLRLGMLDLKYATAQLFTVSESARTTTYYFVATAGVRPEFALENRSGLHFASGAQVVRRGSVNDATLSPSLAPAITASAPGGKSDRIVLVSQEQAERMWKLRAGTASHLLLTPEQYFADAGQVTLQHDGDPDFQFAVIPGIAAQPSASVALRRGTETTGETSFAASVQPEKPQFTITQLTKAGTVPSVKLGPSFAWRSHGVAMAPPESEFALAAKWKIQIRPGAWKSVDDLFLEVNYDGDIARLTSGGKLLDDNFYNGDPWRVGLNRFRREIEQHGLELEILPRREGAPVFLERRYRHSHFIRGQVEELRSVRLIPQYRIEVRFPAS